MKTSWVTGLEPDIAKEIKGDFKSSLLIRNRLVKLLDEKIKVGRSSTLSKTNYDTANWAFMMADNVGYERAMKEVIDLITE